MGINRPIMIVNTFWMVLQLTASSNHYVVPGSSIEVVGQCSPVSSSSGALEDEYNLILF